MKPHNLLMALFVVAFVVIDFIVGGASAHIWTVGPRIPTLIGFVLVGIVFGQVGLMATWLVWGAAPLPLRLLLNLSVAGLLSLPLGSSTNPSAAQWFGVLCVYAVGVATPNVGLRVLGLRCSTSYGRQPIEPHRLADRRWQFTLAGLLGAITAVAILLAAARWMDFPWEFAVEIGLYCGGFVVVALVSLWATWGRRWWVLRVVVVCLLVPAVGAALGMVERPIGSAAIFVVVTLSQAAAICTGALIVRVGGVVMIWPARRSSAESTEESRFAPP